MYFAKAPMDRDQTRMFYPTLDELIPSDHPVRMLDELVSLCDFTEWEQEYHGSRGQPPIPPKLLAKIWLYALSLRIRASRRLEYALGHNIDFMWLAQGHRVDHTTLCKFRTNFQQQLKKLFVKIGTIAFQVGLLRLNEITFDGTRVKSNNANRETLTAEGLQKRLDRLEEQIQRLLQESHEADARDDTLFEADAQTAKLPPKLADLNERKKQLEEARDTVRQMDRERQKQGKNPQQNPARLPTTDCDSRVMPNKEGGFAPNYTPLAAVDTHSAFIVAADVINETNEHSQTVAIVEQVSVDFGVCPERLLADGLHATGQNICAFENSGTELISPLPETVAFELNPARRSDPTRPVPEAEWPQLPRNSQKKLDKSCFVYVELEDTYYCPQGQPLPFAETKSKVQVGNQKLDVRVYRCAGCAGCPLANACQSERSIHGRTISRDKFTEDRERHATRMAKPAAKAAYRNRLHAGETPFAHIKQVFGLRQFLLRGLAKVKTEWLWSCNAYNLMKLTRYLTDLRRRFAQQIEADGV